MKKPKKVGPLSSAAEPKVALFKKEVAAEPTLCSPGVQRTAVLKRKAAYMDSLSSTNFKRIVEIEKKKLCVRQEELENKKSYRVNKLDLLKEEFKNRKDYRSKKLHMLQISTKFFEDL